MDGRREKSFGFRIFFQTSRILRRTSMLIVRMNWYLARDELVWIFFFFLLTVTNENTSKLSLIKGDFLHFAIRFSCDLRGEIYHHEYQPPNKVKTSITRRSGQAPCRVLPLFSFVTIDFSFVMTRQTSSYQNCITGLGVKFPQRFERAVLRPTKNQFSILTF